MRYHYTFVRIAETKFSVAGAGFCSKVGHSASNPFPHRIPPEPRKSLSTGLQGLKAGVVWVMYLTENVFCTLFNVPFLISVLHSGTIISHPDSRALMKVILSMDNCQIGVSVGRKEMEPPILPSHCCQTHIGFC